MSVCYCYIIYSERLNKYYIGSTSNLQRRIEEHNRGKEKFTKTGIPWKLVYSEEFNELKDARKRELCIKKNEKQKIY